MGEQKATRNRNTPSRQLTSCNTAYVPYFPFLQKNTLKILRELEQKLFGSIIVHETYDVNCSEKTNIVLTIRTTATTVREKLFDFFSEIFLHAVATFLHGYIQSHVSVCVCVSWIHFARDFYIFSVILFVLILISIINNKAFFICGRKYKIDYVYSLKYYTQTHIHDEKEEEEE